VRVAAVFSRSARGSNQGFFLCVEKKEKKKAKFVRTTALLSLSVVRRTTDEQDTKSQH
jgi:hypothetical protein